MKRWKKALVSLLTGCLVCGMVPATALASGPVEQPDTETTENTTTGESEGYRYRVTLSAGNQGLIDGKDKIVITKNGNDQLMAGDSVIIEASDQTVEVQDERYYVKGVRESGRDNEEYIVSPNFLVTGDKDYVVVYGIKGDQVEYTVQYQDADGNALAASRTYYGNIGDKPIVAYQYIDGYIPQTLALTKTLSANAADNIFTFVYVPGDPGEIVNTVTDTTTVVGDPTIVTVVTGGVQTAGGGAGGGAGAGAGDAGDGGAGDAGVTIEEDQTPQGVQDIVDLDEEETPMGDLEVEEEETAKGLPLAFSVGIGAVAAVALICLVVWLAKGRKSGNDGTTEE